MINVNRVLTKTPYRDSIAGMLKAGDIPWPGRFDICDKAIPWAELNEDIDFHIVWNPGHPSNPRFAFADKADAELLRDALKESFPGGQFLIMTHWANVEAQIVNV